MKIDLTQAATWVPLLLGLLIPFLVELLTKIKATSLEKSLIALGSLGLTALGTYLAASGAHTLTGAVTAFVLALFSAASSRTSVTGGLDSKLGNAGKLANFGIGSNVDPNRVSLPEAA